MTAETYVAAGVSPASSARADDRVPGRRDRLLGRRAQIGSGLGRLGQFVHRGPRGLQRGLIRAVGAGYPVADDHDDGGPGWALHRGERERVLVPLVPDATVGDTRHGAEVKFLVITSLKRVLEVTVAHHDCVHDHDHR